jgi:hypothetical protein
MCDIEACEMNDQIVPAICCSGALRELLFAEKRNRVGNPFLIILDLLSERSVSFTQEATAALKDTAVCIIINCGSCQLKRSDNILKSEITLASADSAGLEFERPPISQRPRL